MDALLIDVAEAPHQREKSDRVILGNGRVVADNLLGGARPGYAFGIDMDGLNLGFAEPLQRVFVPLVAAVCLAMQDAAIRFRAGPYIPAFRVLHKDGGLIGPAGEQRSENCIGRELPRIWIESQDSFCGEKQSPLTREEGKNRARR